MAAHEEESMVDRYRREREAEDAAEVARKRKHWDAWELHASVYDRVRWQRQHAEAQLGREDNPHYLASERRKEQRLKEARLELQQQLLNISLFGPRTEQDLVFIRALQDGNIDLEELRRPVWDSTGAGQLVNPLDALKTEVAALKEKVKAHEKMEAQQLSINQSLMDGVANQAVELSQLRIQHQDLLKSFQQIKDYFEDIHGVLEQARQEEQEDAEV